MPRKYRHEYLRNILPGCNRMKEIPLCTIIDSHFRTRRVLACGKRTARTFLRQQVLFLRMLLSSMITKPSNKNLVLISFSLRTTVVSIISICKYIFNKRYIFIYSIYNNRISNDGNYYSNVYRKLFTLARASSLV